MDTEAVRSPFLWVLHYGTDLIAATVEDAMSEIRSYFKGPRWARFDLWLKTYCHVHGIDVEVDRQTSLLRETVLYKATADSEKLRQMQNQITLAIHEYNK